LAAQVINGGVQQVEKDAQKQWFVHLNDSGKSVDFSPLAPVAFSHL
jgi:hypothetical protein